MKKLGIVIINRNNIKFISDLVKDLDAQSSKDFEVIIIDNGSNDMGITMILDSFLDDYTFIKDVVFNETNRPLNHLWNEFHEKNNYEYFCFLNNDIRIPANFISDTIQVLDENPDIGCAAHSTNHPKYDKITELKFVTFNDKYRQGWDYTMRKAAYHKIPEELHFFCGDDFLYEKLYENGWKFAIITSSPIIHYQGKTPRIPGISNKDIAAYKKMGFRHPYMNVNDDYCKFKPTFNEIR